MNNIELWQGDCLELMKNIPDGSVDLVLTDPPYGTIKGIEKSRASKDCGYRACDWDEIIPTDQMFAGLSRVLRPNGKAILFAQEPYTSTLVKSAIPSLPFLYRAMWYKNTAGNILGAKSAMVNRFEDICLFSKNSGFAFYDFDGRHPLRGYNQRIFEYIGKSIKEITEITGSTYNSHYWTDGFQFSVITEKDYKIFEREFHIEKMQGYLTFAEMTAIKESWEKDTKEKRKKYYEEMNAKYPSVFNLWQGGKSKSNVLEYKKDNDGYHPTQKPVALLEDLIQTYSNEGNTVLDFTMGSGSTGVACVNTNRNFIGIELDEGYFNIAKKRIEEAYAD